MPTNYRLGAKHGPTDDCDRPLLGGVARSCRARVLTAEQAGGQLRIRLGELAKRVREGNDEVERTRQVAGPDQATKTSAVAPNCVPPYSAALISEDAVSARAFQPEAVAHDVPACEASGPTRAAEEDAARASPCALLALVVAPPRLPKTQERRIGVPYLRRGAEVERRSPVLDPRCFLAWSHTVTGFRNPEQVSWGCSPFRRGCHRTCRSRASPM